MEATSHSLPPPRPARLRNCQFSRLARNNTALSVRDKNLANSSALYASLSAIHPPLGYACGPPRIEQQPFRHTKRTKGIQNSRTMPITIHCCGDRLPGDTSGLGNIHEIDPLIIENALYFSFGVGPLPPVGCQLAHHSPPFARIFLALIKNRRPAMAFGMAYLSRHLSTAYNAFL